MMDSCPSKYIEISATTCNDGFYRIAAVSSDTITLADKTDAVNLDPTHIKYALTTEFGSSDVQMVATYLVLGNPAIDFVDGGAAADTIVRKDGLSFLAQGFKRGQTLRVSGTPDGNSDQTGDNDNEFTITQVTDTTITIDFGAQLVPGTGIRGVTITAQGSPADISIALIDPNVQLRKHDVELEFDENGGLADTITRLDGVDWSFDGFAANQTIIVQGTGVNDGSYRVASVAGSVMTLDNNSQLTRQSTVKGVDIQSVVSMIGPESTGDATGLMFSSTSNDGGVTYVNTITRKDGKSWNQDGFIANQRITIAGTFDTDPPEDANGDDAPPDGAGENDGSYVIASVLDDAVYGSGATLRLLGSNRLFQSEDTELNPSGVDVEVTSVRSIAEPVLTFSGTTISRDRGSWLDDGFTVGKRLHIEGTIGNNLQFEISAISGDGKTLTVDLPSGVTLTEEVAIFAIVRGLLSDSQVNPAGTGKTLTVGDVGDQLLFQLGNIGIADSLKYLAQAVLQDSSSSISVGAGAKLKATGDVWIASVADSTLQLSTESLWIGVTYGRSHADARTTIANGASIEATGSVDVHANVVNNMNVATKMKMGLNPKVAFVQKGLTGKAGLIPGPAAVVTVGEAQSTSTVNIDIGSIIRGLDVQIGAINANNFTVAGKASINGLKVKNTGEAAAVSVSNVNSDATANVGGTILAMRDLSVRSQSINANNDTDARSKVTLKAGGLAEAAMKAAGQEASIEPAADPGAIAGAAAVTVANSTNEATTKILTNAKLSAQDDLLVSSYTEDNFKVIGIAKAKIEAKFVLAGTVGVSSYLNQAITEVQDGAILNAGDVMSIKSDSVIPNQIEIDDVFRRLLAPPTFTEPTFSFPDVSDPVTGSVAIQESMTEFSTWGSENVGPALSYFSQSILPLLRFSKWIPNLIATSDFAAVAGGKKTKPVLDANGNPVKNKVGKTETKEDDRTSVAISGTVNSMSVDNKASAIVGMNVRINDDNSPLVKVTPTPTQRVDIQAHTSMETIDLSGISSPTDIAKIFKGGGTTGKVGVGGTYQGLAFTSHAFAHVDDGAVVRAADDVRVTADNRGFLIAATQQGGNATKVGISGSFSIYELDNKAIAYIEDTASIYAGGDLVVDAKNDFFSVNVSSVMQKGGNVSVGAGVAINAYDTTTQAFIGNKQAPVGMDPASVPPGQLTRGVIEVGNDLSVQANSTNDMWGFGLAGSQPSGAKEAKNTKNNPSKATTQVDQTSTATGSGASELKFGVGFSGDVAVNFIKDTTEAFISGVDRVVVVGDVNVHAETSSFVVAVTGAIVFNKGQGGASMAGAFTWNELSGQLFADESTANNARVTKAYIEDTKVFADSVSVTAFTHDRPFTITAGIGLSAPKKDDQGNKKGLLFNLAGSATVGQYNTETIAYIGDKTTVDVDRDVIVDANYSLDILSVTGAIVVRGKGAVGAAVDVGIVENLVNAYIGDADVQADGSVRVTSRFEESTISVAASLAALAETIALPISVNIRIHDSDSRAYIGKGASVTTGNHLLIDAGDVTDMIAVAGSGAFQSSRAVVGIAVGVAEMTRDVEASIREGATVDQGDLLTNATPGLTYNGKTYFGVKLNAHANDDIVMAVASGAAGTSQTISASLSPAIVIVNNTVEAFIGSPKSTLGATVHGSEIGITSTSSPKIYSLAIAGSVAAGNGNSSSSSSGGTGTGTPANNQQKAVFQFAGAGAGSGNIVTNTVRALIRGSSTVVAEHGSVSLSAQDGSEIVADAGGIGLAFKKGEGSSTQFTVGASASINETTNTVLAAIEDSRVDAAGSILVNSISTAVINALTIAGAAGIALGGNSQGSGTGFSFAGAGAGSGNKTRNNTRSRVKNSRTETTNGNVTLSAIDNGSIYVDSGAVALALKLASKDKNNVNLSIGASIAINDISNGTRSAIESSQVYAHSDASAVVPATSNVQLIADSNTTIKALTIAGALSATLKGSSGGGTGVNFAGAGAGSGNTIKNTIEAVILSSQVTSEEGTVTLSADDDATIHADAGAVALALDLASKNKTGVTGSLGASIGINEISNTIRASVAKATGSSVASTIQAKNDVSI